jgi:hypothetical protein
MQSQTSLHNFEIGNIKDNTILEQIEKWQQNEHIGEQIQKMDTKRILRVYHHNICGAKVYQNWNKWRDRIEWLKTNNIGIGMLVETNTTWTRNNIEQATANAKKITNNALVAACSSNDKKMTDYQPGGAACLLINSLTEYHLETITDNEGLGRWSGFKLKGKTILQSLSEAHIDQLHHQTWETTHGLANSGESV